VEPQILRLTGVEVQIEVYRGATSTFDAYLTYANSAPVNLDSPPRRVLLKITDKTVGGVLKYQQVNEPGTHVNAAGGQTRFSIPPTVTEGLTDLRSYTWKYVILMEDTATGSCYPFFHGDLRVLTPNALLGPLPPVPVDPDAYKNRVLADGATAYWALDEPVGSPTVADATGGTAPGIVHGSVLLGVPGPGAYTAANFLAENWDAYIALPLTALPPVFTLEAWIRQPVSGFYTGNPANWFSNAVGLSAGDRVTIGVSAAPPTVALGGVGTAASFSGLTPTNDAGWHHVAVVGDPTRSRLWLYLDGVPDAVVTFAAWTPSVSAGAVLSGNDDVASAWWDGDLASVALYPRALTAEEITAHRSLMVATRQVLTRPV